MILVDTAVWIDHLRCENLSLTALLEKDGILGHPFVLGELAMGSFKRRDLLLKRMRGLPQAVVADDVDVLRLVNNHQLFGKGLGYVDVHLLVAVLATPEALLWTRDRRLSEVAFKFGVSFPRIQ